MILSHVSFCCKEGEENAYIDKFLSQGYELLFVEKNLKNNSLKRKFMYFNQGYHNIFYLKHKSFVDVEIISYKKLTTNKSSLFTISENKIYVPNRFYRTLIDKFNLKAMDNYITVLATGFKKIQIVPYQEVSICEEVYLDSPYMHTLAFFSSSIETDFFLITVNHKTLKVKFVKLPCGFVELLEVTDNENSGLKS